MTIEAETKELAAKLGIERRTTESDLQFERRVWNLKDHIDLARKAKELGAEITHGMTSAELRHVIGNRLEELLEQQGLVVGAHAEIQRGKIVEIRAIRRHPKHQERVNVSFWVVSPWDSKDNRGRANNTDASTILGSPRIEV